VTKQKRYLFQIAASLPASCPPLFLDLVGLMALVLTGGRA